MRMLQTPSVRKALLIGVTLQLFQQLAGINTVIYYSARILQMSGISNKVSEILWISAGVNAINFCASFIGETPFKQKCIPQTENEMSSQRFKTYLLLPFSHPHVSEFLGLWYFNHVLLRFVPCGQSRKKTFDISVLPWHPCCTTDVGNWFYPGRVIPNFENMLDNSNIISGQILPRHHMMALVKMLTIAVYSETVMTVPGTMITFQELMIPQ